MSPPISTRFLARAGSIEPQGSPMLLDTQQIRLREKKACGFTEIQAGESLYVLQLFAQGLITNAYLLEDGQSKPFQLINLSTIWNGTPAPIRAVEFPPYVGRLLWLALESPLAEQISLAGKNDLQAQIAHWQAESFSGLAQLSAENIESVFFVKEGVALPLEAFFYDGNSFYQRLPFDSIADAPISLSTRRLNPDSQSFQCLTLRLGITAWGDRALKRYQELAGQKLTRQLQNGVQQVCQPAAWNLFIENAQFRDEHFFSYAQTAAQSYRAVLMEVGGQMEQVVGGALAQRILSETFGLLCADSRAALELHRLIPAAFVG